MNNLTETYEITYNIPNSTDVFIYTYEKSSNQIIKKNVIVDNYRIIKLVFNNKGDVMKETKYTDGIAYMSLFYDWSLYYLGESCRARISKVINYHKNINKKLISYITDFDLNDEVIKRTYFNYDGQTIDFIDIFDKYNGNVKQSISYHLDEKQPKIITKFDDEENIVFVTKYDKNVFELE